MKDEVAKLLEKVRKNDGSAFTIVEFVLDDIVSMARSGKMSRERWQELALGLLKAKGRMAPLYNIANIILLNLEEDDFQNTLMKKFDNLHKYHTDSEKLISDTFISEFKPGTIMVNSYSSTVMECLTALSKKIVDLKVVVTESLPMGEGVMFAEALAGRKINTTIIADSMTFEWMRKVDIFLCGADAVIPGKIFNKVGSEAIAHAAKLEGKQIVVVCDSLKLSPVELGDSVSKCNEIGPRLKRCTSLFESFDSSLVDRLITEKWSCSGKELPEKFRDWRRSPALDKGR